MLLPISDFDLMRVPVYNVFIVTNDLDLVLQTVVLYEVLEAEVFTINV